MKKILIVDDDIGNRTFVVQALMKEWPESAVLSAPNGRIGLEIALDELPEIILLDWEMPEMDGIAMLKALRGAYETKSIPVIMYTGMRTDSSSLQIALEHGANEFLRKPVDAVELIARIRSILLHLRLADEKAQAIVKKNEMETVAREREILMKKNDLASLSLLLQKKDSKLKEILALLETGLSETHEAGIRQKMNAAMIGLRSELNSQSNWEAIKVRMNGIHSEFIAQLTQIHPDLSPNELKLCTLMKLNISQKEVAEILGISVAAVEKARYRLRKKLQLEAGVKLDNYVFSIAGGRPV